MILAYASRTGTKTTLNLLRKHGWGLLLSATGAHRSEGFEDYVLDNGAWTAYQKGEDWNEALFLKLLASHGEGARFTVLPDIVGGGLRSLNRSLSWADRVLRGTRMALIPVQEGIRVRDVERYLGPSVGVFIGGATDGYKEGTAGAWGAVCRRRGAWCHMGRVNSVRRINLCAAAGVHSFDGTSVTRFSKTIHRLDAARRQQLLFP